MAKLGRRTSWPGKYLLIQARPSRRGMQFLFFEELGRARVSWSHRQGCNLLVLITFSSLQIVGNPTQA